MVNHRMFHLLNVHPRHRFAHLKLAHFHEHHNPKKLIILTIITNQFKKLKRNSKAWKLVKVLNITEDQDHLILECK